MRSAERCYVSYAAQRYREQCAAESVEAREGRLEAIRLRVQEGRATEDVDARRD